MTSGSNSTKRKSVDKSSELTSNDRSLKEEKDVSTSKNKSMSPIKRRQNRDSIQIEKSPTFTKKQKKKVTWSKSLIDTVDVASFKKYNLQNTHEDPPFLKEKIKCGCLVF